MSFILRRLLFLILLICSAGASAGHSFGGMDLCALYPEIMPPGLNPEQLPQANGRGAALMQNYCTQCHELPGPGRHTAAEWPQVLERMLTLMDVANRFGGLLGNIKMPDLNEQLALQDYLTRYALLPMTQKPKGPGASIFENHCGACHALPDPKQYNMDKWLAVLKRMQRNMVTMKYPLPSAEGMLQIQLYLQRHQDMDAMQKVNSDVTTQTETGSNSSPRFGSWLALGPFLLLVLLGLLRWWYSGQRRTGQQVQV